MTKSSAFDVVRETASRAFAATKDAWSGSDNDRIDRISKAVIECAGALGLIAAFNLFEKSPVAFFIPGPIANTMQCIVSIAVLVLVFDVVRRCTLVYKPELYTAFYNYMPEYVQGWIPAPEENA